MDFRKQQGMEADAFKEEDHMSQQTASDLASMVPSSNIINEKVMPSLFPGRVDNMSDSSSKQCPLLCSSEAGCMMGNSNVSTDNLSHNQAFQHARQLYYLANSDFFHQKLASSVNQAGIHDASDTLEMFTPPLLPASEPGMNHCAPTYKNIEQTPGQQDQVMKQQMEQLQRLVAEQQKIIALYNPDNSQIKERSFPETFSAVKEEQRQQVKEEIPPSSFGIEGKMKTGNIEDRPIAPEIGIGQKPSEEFVEEQLKVDNHLIAKQQKEQQTKAKGTPRKAFLKRKEGMVRLKKNNQKPLKEDSKHSRKAGLDCWGHFSQPGQVDAGILQPGECSQLSLQVSSSMQMGTQEKKADCALAEWEIKAQTDCEAKLVEQSTEEKEVIGRDEDTKENPVDSAERRWPEILQPSPEPVTEMNLQVGEERETHHMDSLLQAGRTDGRSVEGTLQKDLGRVDQPLKGHLIGGAKTPLEVLQKHSPLQDLETDLIKEAEWSAGPAFTQGQKRVQVCPQELVSGSQSSEGKRQIHTGFKMVNDKIVKITCSSPEAVEKGISSSALQQEWQKKGKAVLTWHVASLSHESSSLSSNSDDDPKSHHAQYPSQHGPQGVDQTDRHLDLSDGDYASDEPSGTEKMSLKKTRMDQLKTVRSQEPSHPLQYNRDQIHPLQKEKIAHSKFKGTASINGENVKSEEIQLNSTNIAFAVSSMSALKEEDSVLASARILKQQIVGLQEEFKRNESCWHAAYGKLRDQVEILTRQNMELRDELRVSEHQRWKAEKNPEAVNFMDRKSKTPPPKSILSRRSVLHQERRKSKEEVQEKIEYPDGKVEEVLTDGRRIITFRNGTKREISADKRMTTISFFNGDVKKIMPDQRVIYYYADAQTTHTAYPDGLEVLQFPNNQIEKHYPDGTQEIVFPDHTVKCLYSDGFKETFFPDGTVVKVEKNGDKIVVFSNGQKEVHTAQFKRREYPDGTVKTVYRNGRQETKYSTGRVRIKDEEGNTILDKK
nr:PREDICTED: centromere protein J-like [Pelecanus crispus]